MWFLLWVGWVMNVVAQPTPYLGKPHPVPGLIEAEHYDLGGEGVAFHGLGLIATNSGVTVTFPPGRPGDAIAQSDSSVILRTGEWLNYSVDCEQEGYYAVLIKSSGSPFYIRQLPWFPDINETIYGEVRVHIEVDGRRASENFRIQNFFLDEFVCPRIWMGVGPHQVRLVVDLVTDLFAHRLWGETGWTMFSFAFDWIQFRPAIVPLFPTPLAGGQTGFRDGAGGEAQFGALPKLVGELPDGDLVVQDTANAALRIVSRDGRVRTLAGSPGSPLEDGVGTEAGFGNLLHTLLAPEGHLLTVENDGLRTDRVRRVEPDGTVTTIYRGRPEVPVGDGVSAPSLQEVPLSRVSRTDSGKIRVAGEYTRYEVVFINHGLPEYDYVTRSATFDLEGGIATLVDTGPPLPPAEPQQWSDGYRRDTGYFPGILRVQPVGFIEVVTPESRLARLLRSKDGTFFCVSLLNSRQICRLDPSPTASRLWVESIGKGTISATPLRMVQPDEEIVMEAQPTTRFTQFLGWSDGSKENPRTLRISRDTYLTGTFGLVLPDPMGIRGNRLRVGADRSFQVGVVGSDPPYRYRVQTSRDLIHWNPPPAGTTVLFRDGVFSEGILSAKSPTTWLSVPYIGNSVYVRLELLDE